MQFNDSGSESSFGSSRPFVVLAQKLVLKCHIVLPDTPRPMSAIFYGGHYYAYVRFYSAVEAAQRGAMRLLEKGNRIVLTRVPKGLVLWVLEPDAKLAKKPFA